MPSNTFNCFTIPRNRLKRLLLQRAQTKNRPSHFRDRHLESFSRRRGHSCCRTIAVCGFLYCASIHLFPFCLLVEANKCEGTAKLVVSSVSNRNCLLWKARRAEQSQIQYPIKTPAGLFLFFFASSLAAADRRRRRFHFRPTRPCYRNSVGCRPHVDCSTNKVIIPMPTQSDVDRPPPLSNYGAH